jgi:hypothetical protein
VVKDGLSAVAELRRATAAAADNLGDVLQVRPTDVIHPIVAQPRQQRRRINQVAENNDGHPVHAGYDRALPPLPPTGAAAPPPRVIADGVKLLLPL